MEGRSHHRSRRTVAALLAASLLALHAPVTHAETLEAEAQTLFKRGVAALQKNSFPVAADAFKRSYELIPKPAAICNLAITYDRWTGHEAEALTAYRTCAEDDRSGRFRDHALERSRALRNALPQPDPEPEPVPPPPKPRPEPTPVPVYVPPPPRPEPAPVVEPRPAPAQRRRTHGFLIGGAVVTVVGIALLGAAIAYNQQSNDNIKKLQPFVIESDDGTPLLPPSQEGLLRETQALQDKSKALYGAGGAVTAVGVTLMIVDAAVRF